MNYNKTSLKNNPENYMPRRNSGEVPLSINNKRNLNQRRLNRVTTPPGNNNRDQ